MNEYRNHPLYRTADFDGVFAGAWMMYKKYFLLLLPYSLILSLMMTLPAFLVDFNEIMNLAYENPEEMMSKYSGMMGLAGLVYLLIFSALVLIQHYFIIYGELDKGKSHLSMLGTAFARFYPSVLITIFIALLILAFSSIIGVFLFIVGIILVMLYCAVVFFPLCPVIIVEEQNPLITLVRSVRLVHKQFWPVAGQVLVFIILYIIVSLITGLLSMIPLLSSFADLSGAGPDTGTVIHQNLMVSPAHPLPLILSATGNALITPFAASMATAVYFNLKASEDMKG